MILRPQLFFGALACLFLTACEKAGDSALSKMKSHVDNLKHYSDPFMKNVRQVRFDVTESKSIVAPFAGMVEWDCELIDGTFEQQTHYSVRAKFRDQAWFVESVSIEAPVAFYALRDSTELGARKRAAYILKMQTD